MKEVVVMLMLISVGVLSAQSIPELAEQIAAFHQDGEYVYYPKYAFLRPDHRITQGELLAYNQHLGIRIGEPVGLHIERIDRLPDNSGSLEPNYSHPSSLMSATSNPSERSASPVIF